MLLTHPSYPQVKIYLRLHRSGFLAAVLAEDPLGLVTQLEESPFWANVVAHSLSRLGARHVPLVSLHGSSAYGFSLTTDLSASANASSLVPADLNPFNLSDEELSLSLLTEFDSLFDLGLLHFLGGFKCTDTSRTNSSVGSPLLVSTYENSTTPLDCLDLTESPSVTS